MSFYNLLMGMNANLAAIISTILGFRVDEKFPRFRDIFTEAEDAPFKADVYVYTRTGGGNRDCRENYEEDCDCPGCRAERLERESWIVGSYDDDFDFTYRTFGIRFTPEQKEEWEMLKQGKKPDGFDGRLFALFPKLCSQGKRP